MASLTKRQHQMLAYMVSFQERHGSTPSAADISAHFDYSHHSTAYEHLRRIEKKGYLRIEQAGTRAPLRIVLTDRARQLFAMSWPLFGHIPAGPITEVFAEEGVEIRTITDLLPMIQKDDYFLRVEGDSMIQAGLKEGMTLLMRPTQEVQPGDICAVWVEGVGGTLKRVFPEDSALRLVPENDAYEEQRYPAEQVVIQGVLVAALIVESFRSF